MKKVEKYSLFEVIKREFIKDKLSLFSLAVFVSLILFIFITALFLDQNKIMEVNPYEIYLKPFQNGYILGTDAGGRSVFGQLIIGARNSLIISMCITFISAFIGISIGLIAGYYGGLIDNIIMRIIDFISILPGTMIIIVLITLIPKYNVFYFIAILTMFTWLGASRMIRSKTLSETSKEYIMASKSVGSSDGKIIFKELLPNISSIIIVYFTLAMAGNIGIETGLSFLGYGLPLSTPSLGTLVNYATRPEIISERPYIWAPAVLIILILTLTINYIGDTLKRVSDAKQRLG